MSTENENTALQEAGAQEADTQVTEAPEQAGQQQE